MVNVKLTQEQVDLVYALVSGELGKLTVRLNVLEACAVHDAGSNLNPSSVARLKESKEGTERMMSDLQNVLDQLYVECKDGRGKVR